MTEHTADLRREEIALPLSEEEIAALRDITEEVGEGMTDWLSSGQTLRLLATLDDRVTSYDKALRRVLALFEGSYTYAESRDAIAEARAVLSGETRTGGDTE